MRKIIVTTSWDDGDKADLRLLELLNKYKIKGTFYIPAKNQLIAKEIRIIDQSQEVGAHTVNHQRLTEIAIDLAKQEVIESKKYLADILNQPPKMFCYPFGSFNQEIKELVKNSGFIGARTTETFIINRPQDPFEFGTTINIYPYPLRKRDAHHYHWSKALFQPMLSNYPKIFKNKLAPSSYFSWLALAKNLIDLTKQKGGVFHLWGHSWEIERYGLWQQLEEIFKYLGQQKEVIYLTNSEVIKYFKL